MSSVNISIREEVYNRLCRMKKEGESFSSVIERLAGEKDISKCYGLLASEKESLEKVAKEAEKARRASWRR